MSEIVAGTFFSVLDREPAPALPEIHLVDVLLCDGFFSFEFCEPTQSNLDAN